MTTQTHDQVVVRAERVLPVSPHRAYRAWLEPGLVRRWMAPGRQEVTRVEIDERAGGAWPGWESVLTKLEQVLAETSPAGAVTG